MRRIYLRIGLTVALLVVGLLAVARQAPALPLAPTDPTYRAIVGALRLQNEIEAEAAVTLDDSRLTEVLADDPRGGLYGDDNNAFYLQTVRWYTGNPQLQGWQVGALSARQAYYGYLRALRDLYTEALASGAIKGQTQFAQLPAAQALMQASGFGASLQPTNLPTHVGPVSEYPIESISVAGDLAYMRVTFPCAKSRLIFAQHDGRWYMIGGHIMQHLGCG